MKKLTLTFLLFAILAPILLAQNPVTNTVQVGPVKTKDVLVIFEVEFKGITPKPIQKGVLTDALTAEFAEAGTFSIVDRDTLYYYFKQIQEKTKKPCEGADCLADLAANLDADLFVKAEVSKAGKECRFSAKLYKRKPQTTLYFVDQTKIESCLCEVAGLEKAAGILGRKLTSREVEKDRDGKELQMILIPAGEFIEGCVGAAEDKYCNKAAFFKIYLNAYYIDKFEVTVDQYAKCVQTGSCSDYHMTGYESLLNEGTDFTESPLCNWGKSEKRNHPVNCVNWNQAKIYCEWAGKRLPTAAEWKKAARGTDGRIYPWGNEKPTCDYAVMDEIEQGDGCGLGSTWPVGSKPKGASPYGVMDIVGNVSEWVNDWYDSEYSKKIPSRNPQGPSSGYTHVIMNCGWMEFLDAFLRTDAAGRGTPQDRTYVMGFRCAKDAK